MKLKQVIIDSFAFHIHPEVANYPDALAVDGPLINSGQLDIDIYVALHPPTFAIIEGQTFLVANLLSMHLNQQVLGRAKFAVAMCDSTRCSQHSDVAKVSVNDHAVYRGLVLVLSPSTVSKPTNIRKQHLDAKQICPVCVNYKSDKVKPLEVPLSADQNWRGARARGLGGVVKCHRCKFRLELSHEEYSRFLDYSLATSEVVTMRLDGIQPVICPACATRDRRGIVLMRWYEDCVVTRCSRCLYDLEVYSLNAEAA